MYGFGGMSAIEWLDYMGASGLDNLTPEDFLRLNRAGIITNGEIVAEELQKALRCVKTSVRPMEIPPDEDFRLGKISERSNPRPKGFSLGLDHPFKIV